MMYAVNSQLEPLIRGTMQHVVSAHLKPFVGVVNEQLLVAVDRERLHPEDVEQTHKVAPSGIPSAGRPVELG